jgi:hypothetical protein
MGKTWFMHLIEDKALPPRVIQAAGMVSVQADCSGEEAVALLQRRAEVFDREVEDLAEAVVDRRVRFGLYSQPTKTDGSDACGGDIWLRALEAAVD